jgi:hypothetical protein
MGHISLGVVLLHVNACLLMTQEVSITNLRNYVHTLILLARVSTMRNVKL